jgi:hypothetical protein
MTCFADRVGYWGNRICNGSQTGGVGVVYRAPTRGGRASLAAGLAVLDEIVPEGRAALRQLPA